MKANKILLGGITGGVAFFLLGWLVYGILLMNYTMANYNQCAMRPMEDMIWWALIISNFAFGFLLATTLSWANASGVMDGIKVGGIVGLLFSLNVDFSFYSMSTTFSNFGAVLVDICVFTVMTIIVAIIITLVTGKK